MGTDHFTPYDRSLRYLNRKVARADREFGLLHEGDHVLVAVSGGKDSLVMLEVLARRLAWHQVQYRLTACFVDGGHRPPGCGYAAILGEQCAGLGVPLRVVQAEPLDPRRTLRPAGTSREPSPCFLCSWRRRKALFLTGADPASQPALAGAARDYAAPKGDVRRETDHHPPIGAGRRKPGGARLPPGRPACAHLHLPARGGLEA